MRNNLYLYFLSLNIFKNLRENIAIVTILTLLIFLLSSVLFISSSIEHMLLSSIKTQPSFVVQKIQGGNLSPINEDIANKISKFPGVKDLNKRVWGRYFNQDGSSFLIIGVDFLEEQSNSALKKLLEEIKLRDFFSTPSMIVGYGVNEWLKKHFYNGYYSFITPNGDIKKIKIFKVLPKDYNFFSSDLIIVPIDTAKEILGYKENQFSDLLFNVPNESEWDNLKSKIESIDYNIRVVTKKDIKKDYDKLFNYKNGFFLAIFLIAITTFALILYHQYSNSISIYKKFIGILRAAGWSVKDILIFKFQEAFILFLFAYVVAIFLGYIYVFIFNAPILRDIFIGNYNLDNLVAFVPVVDFSILSAIFFIFVIPFFAAILIPVWKIATITPKEAML